MHVYDFLKTKTLNNQCENCFYKHNAVTVGVRTGLIHARSVSKNVISAKNIVGESVNSNCDKTQEHFALSHIPVLTAAIFLRKI